jgi:hypothetical protein
VYTTTLMVLVMAFLFAAIAPLVYPFAAMFFALAYVVYSHNALHVYVPQYETGGIFFFPAVTRLLGGLVATQLTLVGFLLVKRAYGAAAVSLALPVGTNYFAFYVRTHFRRACDVASVEAALQRDALFQKRQVDRRSRRLSTLLRDGDARGDAAPPHHRPTLERRIAAKFEPYLYRQPLFAEEEAAPEEPEDIEIGFGTPAKIVPLVDDDDDSLSDDARDALRPRRPSPTAHRRAVPAAAADVAGVTAPLLGPGRSYDTFAARGGDAPPPPPPYEPPSPSETGTESFVDARDRDDDDDEPPDPPT